MKGLSHRTDCLTGDTMVKLRNRAKELDRTTSGMVHMEIGEPDFDTPENIRKKGKEMIDEGHTHYSPSSGIPELKEAIADYIEESRGFRPDDKGILVTPGAKGVMFSSIMAIVEQGDEVMVSDPAYPPYQTILRYVGARIVPFSLTGENFSPDLDEINEKITAKTKMIIVNSPNNPCGSVLEKDEARGIAQICEDHSLYLLSDEIYNEIIYEGEHFTPCSDGCVERSVLLDGFSKAYAMTGWRLGFGVGPKEVIKRMGLVMSNAVTCIPAFTQWAGVEALRGPQDAVKRMVAQFRERRDLIVKKINGIEGVHCPTPKGAFYVFPDFSSYGIKSYDLASRLLEEKKVAMLAGSSFGEKGEGHLRLSYATCMEDIEKGVKRIAELLAGVPKPGQRGRT